MAPDLSSGEKPARTGRIVFLVTEDWFFVSHFLPMARAAIAMGMEVAVITRVRAHGRVIEATGARVIPLEAERRSLNPFAAIGTFLTLLRLLRRERPDILHAIALRSILLGGRRRASRACPRACWP